VTIRVEGTQEHGIATIWDADVLIWAASQIVEAKDAGLRPSRLMHATPYEILRFIGRGKSLRDYQRLKAALDRLQSTTRGHVHPRNDRAAPAPLLVDQRVEGARRCQGRPLGIELILPDWFYAGVLDESPGADHRRRLLPAHWRHRAVAVPPGAQARRQAAYGWRFDFRTCTESRAALPSFYDFACDLRAHRRTAVLPGYTSWASSGCRTTAWNC
jgi:plasmid replication initiation protein